MWFDLEEIKKQIPNIHINGTMEKRLPGNLNISFKGINLEELLYKRHSKILKIIYIAKIMIKK